MTTTTNAGQPAGDVTHFAVAGTLLDALARQDFRGIAETCHPDAQMQTLLPRGYVEWDGRNGISSAFMRWFGDVEEFQLVDAVIGDVGSRLHLRWRVRVRAARLGDGWFVVEQQVYADTDDHGLISHVRLLCSGYCAEPASRSAGGSDADGAGVPDRCTVK